MDEARRRILARRAAFLAVATTGLASCDPKPTEPHVCLSQVQPPPPEAGPDDAAPDADPPDAAPPMPCLEIAQPCLSVAAPPPPTDAGADAADAGKPPAAKKAKPKACLSEL